MADAMAALHAPPGSALPTNQVIEVESGVDGKVVFESLVRKVPAVLPPLEESRRLQAEVA
jgi:hypothetical protein